MGPALSTGDPESPIVLVKGQLDFSYPCTEYIVLSIMVGRCRLPASKPVLKARLVSALETKM